MGRFLGDLIGTLQTSFKVGKVRLDASAATAQRVIAFPDEDLTLRAANATPTANNLPLRDANNYLNVGRLLPDFTINRLSASGGGRLLLEVGSSATISATNRALSLDSYLDKFRVYESGGTARGFFIDIDACAATAGSNLTPQSSTADATATRLMQNGAHGWGGNAITTTNFDTLSVTGLYQGTSATGAPESGSLVEVIHFQASANQAFQFAFLLADDPICWRVKTGGTWGAWGQVANGTDTGWINMTLINGWTSVSGRTAQYRRIGNLVFFRGAIQNTTFANNNTQFTLIPAGFRAPQLRIMPATCGAFLASATGVVYLSDLSTGAMVARDGLTTSGTVNVVLDAYWHYTD